jgi:hypothetical protein
VAPAIDAQYAVDKFVVDELVTTGSDLVDQVDSPEKP